MKIYKNDYDFEAPPAIIPSGMFIAAVPPVPGSYGELAGDGCVSSAVVYNPMPHPNRVAEYIETTMPAGKIDERLRDSRLITDEELAAYGETLLKIATSMQRAEPPDLVVAPLRGALKPSLLLKVVGGLDCFEYLPFQNRKGLARRKAMRRELAVILRRRSPDRETFRVLVVDTAIGGHGAQDLKEMIVQALGDADLPHSLDVTFHLLHDSARAKAEAVARIDDISRHNTGGVKFKVHRYSVPSLIVEDWESALGIDLRLEGERFIVKPASTAGVFYLRSAGGEVRELYTSDLSQLLLQKMGEFTSDAIRTDPRFKQAGEVWMSHVELL
jgi:hypothetical protein